MSRLGQDYRSDEWTIKTDRVDEFIVNFQKSLSWITEDHPGEGEGLLLQILEQPNKFASFAWSTMPEKTEEVLAWPEFQSSMREAAEIVEELQPQKMLVVGYSGILPVE